MVIQKLAPGGKILKTADHLGGVFAPVVGAGQWTVYNCGPKEGTAVANQLLLYQCPVSAIPAEIWDLLHLWWSCRLTGLPPKPGGFLDQPMIVQLTFPIFEGIMQSVEATRRATGAQQAAGAAVAGMAKLMMGGGR